MGATFLLSPSETKLAAILEDEAMTSSLPEEKGADILLYTDAGLFKWQRKQIPHDFLSSVTDGRFARALPMLIKDCAFFRLIAEGHFHYYPDQTIDMGRLHGGKRVPSRFTKKQVTGILNDLEIVWDVRIRWTDSVEDTAAYLRSVRDFMTAKKHVGLFIKPKVQGTWIVPTSKDIYLWLLQSFPGVGPSTADAIIQHFNGDIPLGWTCSYEELCKVSKLSAAKARELWKALPSSSPLPAKVEGKLAPLPSSLFSNLRNKLGK